MNPCDNTYVERIHCGDPGLEVGGFGPYSLVAITKIVPGVLPLGQLPNQPGPLRLARFRALADKVVHSRPVVLDNGRSDGGGSEQESTVNSLGFQEVSERPPVSLAAIYDKLNGLEPQVTDAMVRHTADRLSEFIVAMKGGLPPLMPDYQVRILDSNHLAVVRHPGAREGP